MFGVHPSTLPTVSHDKHQNQFHQSWDLLSTQILYLFIINNKVRNTGCGSVVERVVSQSEGWGFDPRLRWAACQSVLGQDTEPQTASVGQAGTLHDTLRRFDKRVIQMQPFPMQPLNCLAHTICRELHLFCHPYQQRQKNREGHQVKILKKI